MPICILCGANLKTRGALAKHQKLIHDGRRASIDHVPQKVVLTYFVNRADQTLSCPLDFCTYTKKKCSNVWPMATHFAKNHKYYELHVSYHCQSCNIYIDPVEQYHHLRAHVRQDIFHEPFKPPTPQINPVDNTLEFVDVQEDAIASQPSNDVPYPSNHASECSINPRLQTTPTQLEERSLSPLSSPITNSSSAVQEHVVHKQDSQQKHLFVDDTSSPPAKTSMSAASPALSLSPNDSVASNNYLLEENIITSYTSSDAHSPLYHMVESSMRSNPPVQVSSEQFDLRSISPVSLPILETPSAVPDCDVQSHVTQHKCVTSVDTQSSHIQTNMSNTSPRLSISPNDSPTSTNHLLGHYISEEGSLSQSGLVDTNTPRDVDSTDDEDLQRRQFINNCNNAIAKMRKVLHSSNSFSQLSISDNSVENCTMLDNSITDSTPMSGRDYPYTVGSPSNQTVCDQSPSTTNATARNDQDVAPPLHITKRLHPMSHLHHPVSHKPTLSQNIINIIRDFRPPPNTHSNVNASTSQSNMSHDALSTDEEDIQVDEPCLPGSSNTTPHPARDCGRATSTEYDINDDPDTSQQTFMVDRDAQRLTDFRLKWIKVFSSVTSWHDFSNNCETFASEIRAFAQELFKPTRKTARNPNTRTQARRPPNGRPIQRFDPSEASRIQGLYYHSKKRAARKLLTNNSTSYSGSVEDAETYFNEVFGEKHCNTNLLTEELAKNVPSGKDEESTKYLYSEVSEAEVAAKLSSAANTSPGADRVEYNHLKKIDPQAKILSLMFNRCMLHEDVPTQWKEALTILIHKKGDDTDITNFRPIALMSCIYKLFMGTMAKRLTHWSIETGILSDQQKCARPTEGCYEHTYVMKSLVGEARRSKKKLCIAWLDIRNAFGSVPHSTIRTTLQHIGVPQEFVNLIMNAYTGASTVIKTPNGSTSKIPIRAGVKQGCPMSPILFNLCIELILRKVKNSAEKIKAGKCTHYGTSVSCLAYADDIVVIARNPAALQALLNEASDGAHILGFMFRNDKCASLCLTSTKQRATFVEQNDFTIQGDHIPALVQEDSYRYLGVPIGLIHNIDDIPNIIPDLVKNIDTVQSSLLAPWQKLDAIKTFIQPCLTYALRAGDPEKQSLDKYKKALCKALRDICSLPNRATPCYFFAHKKTGGLAFQEPRTECDIQAIVQGVRMLSSSDLSVSSMAREELKFIVRRSTQSNPTPELISNYLSSIPDPRTEHLYYTYSSLWSRVRQACRRLRVKFDYTENNPITISADESGKIESKNVTSFLHRLVQSRFADELMQFKDQGKVARCLADDQYSNGSTWHTTGLNMRFKDWRFIHRARLNVVPLNVNKQRYSNTNMKCRHCDQPETLPHVICHCRPNMVLIRARHNRIVERITNAVRFGKITTDRMIKDSNLRLRPDIVIEEGARVIIIDVTCPFDNDVDALGDAALSKVNKYQPLKEFVESMGKKCDILPFVVGALGSWYKQNELVLKILGMTRRYKSLFRKLCCTDVIQESNNIYRKHLGCDDAMAVPALEQDHDDLVATAGVADSD